MIQCAQQRGVGGAQTDPSVRCESGFTLLELLVSLVLVALLMVAMPAALHLAKRTQAAASQLDRLGITEAASIFIEQRLSEATAMYDRGDDGRLHVIFRGEPNRLAFIAPVTFTAAQAGLARLEFEIGTDADARSGLIMSWKTWRPPANADQPGAQPEPNTRLLVPNATQFQLRYYGAPSASQSPEWTQSWTRMDRIPDLVEFQILSGTTLDNHVRQVPLRLRLP